MNGFDLQCQMSGSLVAEFNMSPINLIDKLLTVRSTKELVSGSQSGSICML
jgi:hypothetical protein